jgi:hypothetical protein
MFPPLFRPRRQTFGANGDDAAFSIAASGEVIRKHPSMAIGLLSDSL